MAFTVVGFYESFDSATLQALTALPDQHVRVQGDDLIVPRDYNYLLGAYVLGASLTQARIQSPSLRRLVNLDVCPFTRAAAPNADNPRIYLIADNPKQLDEDEALNVLAAEDAAGASAVSAFVLLGAGEPAPVEGDIVTVRATSTNTATANTWTNVQLTFDQSLPAGTYQLVGSRHISANAVFHRYVFVGGIWRPGAPSLTSEDGIDVTKFRHGGMGVWGEFSHNTPPTVDVFCTAADASHKFYLDLIKVG